MWRLQNIAKSSPMTGHVARDVMQNLKPSALEAALPIHRGNAVAYEESLILMQAAASLQVPTQATPMTRPKRPSPCGQQCMASLGGLFRTPCCSRPLLKQDRDSSLHLRPAQETPSRHWRAPVRKPWSRMCPCTAHGASPPMATPPKATTL